MLSGLVHLSGITPALSASCAALVEAVLAAPLPVSFDVNYRPALWPVPDAAPVLAHLAGRADIAFVGLDEAGVLWGAATAGDVRALLPGPRVLVVKDGGTGAVSFGPSGTVFVAAPAVDVVEPVGAGDAYAAGYLYGVLRDLPEPARLRLGHLVAAAALRVTGDVGCPAADRRAARVPIVRPDGLGHLSLTARVLDAGPSVVTSARRWPIRRSGRGGDLMTGAGRASHPLSASSRRCRGCPR